MKCTIYRLFRADSRQNHNPNQGYSGLPEKHGLDLSAVRVFGQEILRTELRCAKYFFGAIEVEPEKFLTGWWGCQIGSRWLFGQRIMVQGVGAVESGDALQEHAAKS